jgi:hypothetical protein
MGTCQDSGTVAGYFISSFGHFGELDLSEIGCENQKWMELKQDSLQWLIVISVVFAIGVLYQKDSRI